MRSTLAIARKELSIYFTTPWAYVVFTAMVAVSSFFFLTFLQDFQKAQQMAKVYGWAQIPTEFKNLTDSVVVPLWNAITVITLFVAPFLSMRLFAEEKREKTFELLMTVPVRPIEIVMGKYLGGLGAITATLGLTIVFPVILSIFGSSESGTALEWTTVLLGYGGLLLWGATCLAIGMFISALTQSQMLAAVVTVVVLWLWMLLKGVTQSVEEPWRSIAGYLSFGEQLAPLHKGMLDASAPVFFGSVIVFCLFLTHRTVEAQRWT